MSFFWINLFPWNNWVCSRWDGWRRRNEGKKTCYSRNKTNTSKQIFLFHRWKEWEEIKICYCKEYDKMLSTFLFNSYITYLFIIIIYLVFLVLLSLSNAQKVGLHGKNEYLAVLLILWHNALMGFKKNQWMLSTKTQCKHYILFHKGHTMHNLI